MRTKTGKDEWASVSPQASHLQYSWGGHLGEKEEALGMDSELTLLPHRWRGGHAISQEPTVAESVG